LLVMKKVIAEVPLPICEGAAQAPSPVASAMIDATFMSVLRSFGWM
jgi:hypothetical protein